MHHKRHIDVWGWVVNEACDDIFWVSLPTGNRLGFALNQGLDLRHVVIEGQDLAPLAQAPPTNDPIISRALQGLLFTCGPDHIRQTEDGKDTTGRAVSWPLHGQFTRHAASQVSKSDNNEQTEVRARVSMVVSNNHPIDVDRIYHINHQPFSITLTDHICNQGTSPIPIMMMYHFNIKGAFLAPAVAVTATHKSYAVGPNAAMERACFAWSGTARMPLVNAPVSEICLTADCDELPFLQLWQRHDASGSVLSIEPVSHPHLPRAELHEGGMLRLLDPGEMRTFKVTLDLANG